MNGWSLLGGADPAPGDPVQLRLRLRRVDQVAGDMRDLSSELGRIARGSTDADWRGEAAEAMRAVLDQFRLDLHPIAQSFENISGVLGRYAGRLDELQASARQALARAKLAEERRRAADGQRRSAAANLAAQQRSLLARQAEEVAHRAATLVSVDPAVQAADAAQGESLASQTARAQRSVQDSSTEVDRFGATVSAAESDLRREKSAASEIHAEWDRASNIAKSGVEGALSQQLLNLSNLEKAGNKVLEGVDAIGRFLEDPLPYLADLRKVIEKVQAFVSKAALFVGIAAKIASLLSFIPGMAGIAVALAGLATILTVVSLVLAAAKLLTGLMLVGSARGGPVGKGDLAVDILDFGLSAAPFLGGTAKVLKPVAGSKQWASQQREIHDTIRRGAILRWGSPREVTKESMKMSAKVLAGETKKTLDSELEDRVKSAIQVRLNEPPRNECSAPISGFLPSAGYSGGGGGGGGGGGWGDVHHVAGGGGGGRGW